MRSRNNIVGVEGELGKRGRSSRRLGHWRGGGLVGFEDVKATKLLVDEGQGLELLGLEHLLVEPGLDLVLLDLGQFLVVVVDVAVELQQGQHLLFAYRANKLRAGGPPTARPCTSSSCETDSGC